MCADAFVLGPGEGKELRVGEEFQVFWKVTTEESSGVLSLLESGEPRGFGPPMHIHHDCAEAFYIVEGEYTIFLKDEQFVCPVGSFVFIPAGVVHSFRVGPVRSRKLNIYTPGAMEGYFNDISSAISDGTISEEVEVEIARRNHMEVTGPPPEGARYV